MKWLFLFLIPLLLFIAPVHTFAQPAPLERFATCDLCGYCQGNAVPGNWESCRACLYPDANPTPTIGDTLKINVDTNTAPAPKLGRHYTMIGCLKTDLADFTSAGAAGNVTQSLLSLLFKVAGGIAFLYLIYGSFLIISSQGNTERLAYGRRVIMGSIIGLIFSLSSLLIVNLLGNNILKIPGFGG